MVASAQVLSALVCILTLQLKRIIDTLDYKLSLTSFAESAAGWGIWLTTGQGIEKCGTEAPSQKFIVNLVQALSTVS